MDRQVVYVGAIPLDTDQLLQSRNTMVGLGYLAKMVIGDTNPVADGLGCTAGAGLSVVIGPGSMTLQSVVDSGYYGSLPPDGDPLLKIGINTTVTNLVVTGGVNVISATVQESGGGSAAVAYYNATNPTQTLVGPGGDGQAQATVVQQRVVFAVTAATAIPTGYLPLWQVTVPTGASQITSGMIAVASSAPFLPVKLPQAAPLQSPAFTGSPSAPTPAVGDNSGLLATTAFVTTALGRNRAAWGTAGSYSWTCPSGVSSVLARMWGAGGNGGVGGTAPGGGGGGGGYIELLLNVAPGTSYTIQVGAGGGGTTSFGTLASAAGGASGGGGQSGTPGAGGTAGVSTSAGISFIGALGVGVGAAGFLIGQVAVGGAGGSTFGSQGGGACFGSSGANGCWPGGGGAGGGTGAGGTGAAGLIILEWLG